jgi:hypothetical protein
VPSLTLACLVQSTPLQSVRPPLAFLVELKVVSGGTVHSLRRTSMISSRGVFVLVAPSVTGRLRCRQASRRDWKYSGANHWLYDCVMTFSGVGASVVLHRFFVRYIAFLFQVSDSFVRLFSCTYILLGSKSIQWKLRWPTFSNPSYNSQLSQLPDTVLSGKWTCLDTTTNSGC